MTDLIAELAEVVSIIDTVRGMPNGTVAHSAGLRVEASECVSFMRNNHATLARILTDDAAIRAAHHDLVIRLGEVTTELEAADALLQFMRDRFGSYMDESDKQAITAHLSEDTHDRA